MAEAFIGEIRMFGGDYAPVGWALCDGSLLEVSQNEALFSLLGTIYGGDGRTTFGLPDLRGRVPIHMGTGPGLTPRTIGSKGGTETETLTPANIPVHNHTWQASANPASGGVPEGWVLGSGVEVDIYSSNTAPLVKMATAAIANSGNVSPAATENLMPYQAINYIIALQGDYPSRI